MKTSAPRAVLIAIALGSLACVRQAPQLGDEQRIPVHSYTGPNAHVMVVIPGGDFMMGSPPTEHGRSTAESQHRVRIPRTYAIATTEVTNEQFARFLASVPDYGSGWRRATAARFGDPPGFAEYSRTPDSPQVAVSWYDAARYCNWLSELAGLPKDQWVYPDTIDSQHGIVLPTNYLRRTGYRLPTESEWEYAARAGTTTAWHFGNDQRLLPDYGWYDGNTNRARMYPVAQRKPNQWGLFDMLGNVWEWTFDRRLPYPTGERVTEDVEDSVLQVSNGVARIRRGGSFAYEWFTLRPAHRGDTTYFPNQTRDGVGFRVARTMPQP
jgi:formylglycine-generating enzyme required for sulfatase activity